MELVDEGEFPAYVKKTGTQQITIAAGKHLKIETTPGGIEILGVVVPVDKEWAVELYVHIKETDA